MPRSTLSPAQVQQLLRRLQPALKVKDFAQLERIAARLDDAGRCTVAQVMQACFADSTGAAAAKAFERLRATVSKAADQQGLALSLEVDANKQLGERRAVCFVGEVLLAFHMLTQELEAAQSTKLIDQQGIPLDAEGLRRIVVITAVANERTALYRQFSPGKAPTTVERDDLEYDDFGRVGSYRLLHINCETGGLSAAVRTLKAIAAWQPDLLVLLGMAFGVKDNPDDPNRQQLGDVLIATAMQGYELQRIGADGNPTLRDIAARPAANWLQRLRQLNSHLLHVRDDAPRIEFGKLLSGQKLVDNLTLRAQLLALTGGDAIGGEMEGVGLAEACHEDGRPWIFLKGIADWGDGNKPSGDAKKDVQVQASANAAWVLHALLDRTLLDSPRSPRGGKRLARPDVRDFANIEHVLENHARRVALDADQLSAERLEDAGVNAFELLLRWAAAADGSAYFALLGEYGMGKTVLCQRLCQHLEQQHERGEPVLRPLYFDLRRITGLRVQATDPHSGDQIWRDRVPTLDETLAECVQRGWLPAADAAAPSVAQVKQWVQQGALVIFDGLDEVLVHLSEANGLQYTHQLLMLLRLPGEGAAPAAPKSKLLVSCRSHFFKSLAHQRSALTERGRSHLDAQRFEALLLLPFSEAQVADYLRSALPSLDLEQAMATLRAVHNLGELAARPYLLKEVARMLPRIEQWRLQGRKVQGVSVYREMVSEWLHRDQGKHQIQPAHKLLVARDLAAELWRRGSRLIDANALSSWYFGWRQAQSDPQLRYAQVDADKLDEDLRNSQFLVRQDGKGEDGEGDGNDDSDSGFRFAHSSLLEFFLAEHLLHALREGAPARWALPLPSRETLDFFGQLLVEAPDQAELLRTLNGWRAPYRAQASELRLHYALRADAAGWPMPNLHGADLRGVALDREAIGRAVQPGQARLSLATACLAGARLRQTVFRGLRLSGADLSGAQLQGAEFHDCVLDSADFSRSDLSGAIFRHCRLDGANFAEATGYRCQFAHCGEAAPTLAEALQVPQPGRVVPVGGHVAWLSGGDGGIKACVFVDDARTLVTVRDDGRLQRWDVRSGECMRVWQGPLGLDMGRCAFAPDGRVLVSGHEDGRLRLWDGESGACLRTWKGAQGEVSACAFAPDGHSVVSGGADGSLRFWDSESGACLRVWHGPQTIVNACAYAPDGSSLAVGGDDGMLRHWDVASGECLRAWHAHQGWIGACAFSPDGLTLVSAGGDGLLRGWDVESGECSRIWQGHRIWITACAFSPDGRALATDSVLDGHLRLMDSEAGECLRVWQAHTRSFNACAFAPDGRSLMSGGNDGVLRRWDAETGDCLRVASVGHDLISAFAADGHSLVSSGSKGGFRVWDSASGECLRIWHADQGVSWIGAYALDRRVLVSGDHDGKLRLWDSESGECLRVWQGHRGAVFALALAPDAGSLVSGGDDGSLRLWDVPSGTCQFVLQGHRGTVLACAFAPDGLSLVSGGVDGTVRLWDSDSGRCLRVLKGHRGGVDACAFAPDGLTLVSAGRDFSLRLWDTYSGQCLRVLQGHQGAVMACAFSPDGRRLLSASDDGTLCLWDAQSGDCLMVLCADDTGTAAWRPQPIDADGRDEPKRLLHASGEMWRHLAWLVPDEAGALQRLPLETFGDVVQP
jgi:WD40 repeat protein/nucleoside phosphorylase